ncbi:hypothetical protein CLV92_104212 [Kineococcus xinjiangensis]|uniref:Uncharacterized protein n=1 Tax=Kineococcus xinjiangensis TaxID=512762 RepID=A0A2S6IT96_9ACTN|nr:hypothetical protein CLV92_104212 [Kineococcus xinjiangensis]
MNPRSARAVLTLLALSTAFVGVWALLAPVSFYSGFPAGRGWVRQDGAFNEHLIRDVGGLHLALAVVSAWAAARPRPGSARLAGAAWLVFAVPHLLYHARHLPPAPVDAVGNLVLLGGSAALAVTACLPWRGSRGGPAGGPGRVQPLRARGARRAAAGRGRRGPGPHGGG